MSSLQGYNVTIFAYGQTSSGKTFTMRGTQESQGLIPLSLTEIFRALKENHGEFAPHHHIISSNSQTDEKCWNVRVSYLELYNEQLNDLLE